jgi:hypothetical protein
MGSPQETGVVLPTTRLSISVSVRRTVPPSTEIEEQIDQLLAVGVRYNPRDPALVGSSIPAS